MKVDCGRLITMIYGELLPGQVIRGDYIPHTGPSQDSHVSASGLNVADYRTTPTKSITMGYQPLNRDAFNSISLNRDELRTQKNQFPE